MSLTPEPEPVAFAGYTTVPDDAGGAAARSWWDANADEYLTDHGATLGAADFLWGPEGIREADVRLLGDLSGLRVLEVGAGAAQCSRWLASRGVSVVATDVSGGMLAAAGRLEAATGLVTQRVQADARALPFADGSFDVAFTAFGALPFVPDAARVHAEVARVLRPGGRWVFATTHPFRWPFPDDPGEGGLTAHRSYFDRAPYVEVAADGRVLYAEYHRTLGDLVADVAAAGLVIDRMVEPEWPPGRTEVWDGWGPVRGAKLPGTLVVATHRPA